MEDVYPGQSLRSLDWGSKTIDHILTSSINCAQVCQVGQLPFGLGFSSNHRAVFANLKTEEILNLCMEDPAHREGRQLSSKNKKLRDKYTESVMISLESQNLFKRVGELHTKALTG